MKQINTMAKAALLSATLSAPALAGVTVIDFGALQDNCCADFAYAAASTAVDPGDPVAVAMLHANAGAPAADSAIANLSDGATLQWTNVSAWNNSAAPADFGDNFFLNRAVDPLDTFFTVTTANPGDIVTIDFVGGVTGVGRDALITISGSGTVVPAGAAAWTNVVTGATGSVTGELTENSSDEGNVGAMRITITPVPEPSSSLLLGMSALALGFLRRRK